MPEEINDQLMELMKLRRKFTVYEISALLLDINPKRLTYIKQTSESKTGDWFLLASETPYSTDEKTGQKQLHFDPKNQLFQEIRKLIIEAINYGELPFFDPNNTYDLMLRDHHTRTGNTDLEHACDNTEVFRNDIKTWVENRGFKTTFFQETSTSSNLAQYLDRNNSEHSLELGIAIEAWERFSNLELSHPKDYIKKWLEEHYSETLSQKAIERITTLVNWNPSGGTKTSAFKQSIYEKAISKKLSKR